MPFSEPLHAALGARLRRLDAVVLVQPSLDLAARPHLAQMRGECDPHRLAGLGGGMRTRVTLCKAALLVHPAVACGCGRHHVNHQAIRRVAVSGQHSAGNHDVIYAHAHFAVRVAGLLRLAIERADCRFDLRIARMCLPGYRGACQGGAKIRAQADRRPPAGLYPDNCLLHQHVQAGIGYRGAQRGQRLVRFVHEQRHGIFATVDADPLVEFSDHRFRAAVAVLLD
ncbi:hypothetical protein D3C71_1584980 [compost metagenome]